MNLDNIIRIDENNKHLLYGNLPYDKVSNLLDFLLLYYTVIHNPIYCGDPVFIPKEFYPVDKNVKPGKFGMIILSHITIDGENYKIHNYHKVHKDKSFDILVKLRNRKFNKLLNES